MAHQAVLSAYVGLVSLYSCWKLVIEKMEVWIPLYCCLLLLPEKSKEREKHRSKGVFVTFMDSVLGKDGSKDRRMSTIRREWLVGTGNLKRIKKSSSKDSGVGGLKGSMLQLERGKPKWRFQRQCCSL